MYVYCRRGDASIQEEERGPHHRGEAPGSHGEVSKVVLVSKSLVSVSSLVIELLGGYVAG